MHVPPCLQSQLPSEADASSHRGPLVSWADQLPDWTLACTSVFCAQYNCNGRAGRQSSPSGSWTHALRCAPGSPTPASPLYIYVAPGGDKPLLCPRLLTLMPPHSWPASSETGLYCLLAPLCLPWGQRGQYPASLEGPLAQQVGRTTHACPPEPSIMTSNRPGAPLRLTEMPPNRAYGMHLLLLSASYWRTPSVHRPALCPPCHPSPKRAAHH